ncbi:MAG: RidA family protein [Bacteroidales bacterium]|jgi:2-iminobutanoate/2-iminopropanoate deaminase|nr:RidA family protein [Bacteroidales bacterium]
MKKAGFSLLFIFLLFTGFSQTIDKKIIQAPDAPKAIGPYSQAVLAGNTLYVSGNIALNPENGQMDTLNLETETRRVMSNLGAVLKEAGMSYENIVKATIYMTDIRNYKEINRIYGEYFKENPPAREAIQVVALPAGAHMEISCIAVK